MAPSVWCHFCVLQAYNFPFYLTELGNLELGDIKLEFLSNGDDDEPWGTHGDIQCIFFIMNWTQLFRQHGQNVMVCI